MTLMTAKAKPIRILRVHLFHYPGILRPQFRADRSPWHENDQQRVRNRMAIFVFQLEVQQDTILTIKGTYYHTKHSMLQPHGRVLDSI
jgi:hypothetical protein